jgi:hypothetical protein
MIDKVDDANEAIDAKEAEADKADAIKAKASVADEAEARVADKAEIDKADKADLTDDADVADKAIATVDARLGDLDEVNKANEIVKEAEIMINEVVLGLLTLLLPFSLTKHSAIFTEVKGFFGINNNQLGSWNSCSLRSQNGTCCVENVFLS